MSLLNLKKNKIEPKYFEPKTKSEPSKFEEKTKNAVKTSSSLMIGENVKITGCSIKADNDVIIQGDIEGDIECHTVIVNKTGTFKGKVQAENMTVEGQVVGEIIINAVLHIKSNGHVDGKIFYKDIEIQDQGKLQGEINCKEKVEVLNKKEINDLKDWVAL